MSRRILPLIALTSLLSCDPALKETPQSGAALFTGPILANLTAPPNPCPACVLPPEVVQSEWVREFAADPAADYLLVIQDDGQSQTGATVLLNERPVVLPADLRMTGVGAIRKSVTLLGANRLRIVPLGPGARVTVWILGGAKVIGPSGGTVTSPEELVQITIPSGALTTSLEISIQPTDEYPGGVAILPGAVHQFEPSGTTFLVPVILTLIYDPAELPAGVSESDLQLFHAAGGSWTAVPGSAVDPATHTVSAPVSGFSTYGVGASLAEPGWSTKAPMPTPRFGHGVGVVNGIIYAVGGRDALNSLGTVEAYDPATDSWTTKASMPTPRDGLGVGVVNGIFYAVGGTRERDDAETDTPYLGTVEAYDPATDSWTTKASMPTARSHFAVGVVSGILYAIGGNPGDGFNYYDVVEAYDPATDSWTTKTAVPTPRAYPAAGVVNDILYAVGGGNSVSQGTVEAYDPATNSWTTKASLLTPTRNHSVGVVNGILYSVSGNECCRNRHDGTVEAYDPATNSWSTQPTIPTGREKLGVGVVNGILYAIGGHDDGGITLATVEAFIP